MKELFYKTIAAIAASILLTGIGVALFVHADLGSDTITVFIDGLHRILHVSYGSASRIYNIGMLAIALLVSFRHIGWATVVYALSVGFSMDFFETMLQPFGLAQAGLPVRFGCVLLGQLCFGLTYALLIRYRKGMNQVDAIAYAITRRTKLSFKWVRTAMDFALLGGGWLLGGVVGVGSLIAMTTTGILIDFFLKQMKKREAMI